MKTKSPFSIGIAVPTKPTKHGIYLVAVISMAFLLFSSCSSDPTSAMQALLEEECNKQSKGYLKLTKFAKHDAVMEKINGVDYYRVNYSIEVEALKDGGYLHICESQGKYGALLSFEVRERFVKGVDFQVRGGECFVFAAEKGHRYQFDETGARASLMNRQMTIAKHEQGWVMVIQRNEVPVR